VKGALITKKHAQEAEGVLISRQNYREVDGQMDNTDYISRSTTFQVENEISLDGDESHGKLVGVENRKITMILALVYKLLMMGHLLNNLVNFRF